MTNLIKYKIFQFLKIKYSFLNIFDHSYIKLVKNRIILHELERCLFVWFCQAQLEIVITDAILIEKAQQFGEMLGINDQAFKYSKGWVEKFKKTTWYCFENIKW